MAPATLDETDLVRPVSIPSDDGYPIETLWLSSNGTTWSPPMPWADTVDWHYLDPALGGSTKVGPRTLYARAQDPAGNLSKVATVSTFIYVDAPIDVSPDPTTGHKITLTPHYPAPVTFPAGTHCYWEVMWGDDQSLDDGNRDETFGFFYTYGPASDGFCKPLAFTLPWMQYPRVMVHYRVEPGSTGESTTDEYIGASPDEPAIVPRIESTNRHITSSSIPLVYVLPDDYVLVVGQPTTYRATPSGARRSPTRTCGRSTTPTDRSRSSAARASRSRRIRPGTSPSVGGRIPSATPASPPAMTRARGIGHVASQHDEAGPASRFGHLGQPRSGVDHLERLRHRLGDREVPARAERRRRPLEADPFEEDEAS